MAVDEATWAAVRRAYESGDVSVGDVARSHGISVSTLYRRARTCGWARRTVRAGRAAGTETQEAAAVQRRQNGLPSSDGVAQQDHADGRKTKPASKVKSTNEKPALLRRLYNAIDMKLSRLEDRMRTNSDLSCADSERETRELSSMIRSFEKVTACAADLNTKRSKRGKAKGDQPRGGVADAERMRLEIAERLEKLFTKGASERGAGGAQSD
ncbi:MAG: helix-turn-helix domain-containing protein [Pseudomonadota bacterium]